MPESKDEVKIISKLEKVPLEDIHIQYVHNVTPIDIWNHDMSLITSPHVELLRTIRRYGWDWMRLFKGRYVKERVNRKRLGFKQWTASHIRQHLKVRWATYLSLKRNGFKPKLYRGKTVEHPIIMLKEPFWKTRFGFDAEWLKGPECWDGAGRLSSACVLGWKTIPVVWAEDRYPGSGRKGRFAKKLSCVDGVWDWTKQPLEHVWV